MAVIKGTGRTVDKVRKGITKIFQSLGLKITVQSNLKNVDFLDVNLDLTTGMHKPYRKPNDEPLYIDTGSNHPPIILKHIHPSIEKRISALSSNEAIFEKAAPVYNQALRASGYTEKITYEKGAHQQQKKRRNRKRQVTWFNPPFSRNVKTNVGKMFLKLIGKHFPRGHKLNKIFNRNTVKVSYSCLPSM